MNRIQTSKIYPWVVVALLWVVALLNYMDRQMLSTMRDAMQFDITELESAVNFGRLMAIFLWIYGFMSPVAGAVADRISRKWLIVVSLGVWSTVTLLMGYSTTFTQIYWLRALMGVVPSLKSMEVGLDFKGSERSYDLVLIALFEDEAGLEAYDAHPAHGEVRKFIRAHRTGTVSVDFYC